MSNEQHLAGIGKRAPFDGGLPADELRAALGAAYRSRVEGAGGAYRGKKEAEAALDSAARWLAGGKPWLLLLGSVGTGKTVTLTALYEHFRRYGRRPEVLGCGRVVEGAMLDSARSIARYSGYEDLLGYMECRVLLIDDFGVEPTSVKSYGTACSSVAEVLYERYERRSPTIISTNLSVAEISERYGERLYDRLCEVCDRILFSFKSFRQP
jgi:DNA replication protein DnaC